MKEGLERERGACLITAGDISRWLGVDLKTVHNWVRRGRLAGRKTDGGHRRFFRAELVRFLRSQQRAVPPEVQQLPVKSTIMRLAPPLATHSPISGRGAAALFELLLDAADGFYEIVVLSMDGVSDAMSLELVTALNHHRLTRPIVTVGVVEELRRQRDFVAAGGDAAVGDPSWVEEAISWLTGATQSPSGRIVTQDSLGDAPESSVQARSEVRSLFSTPRASTR